MRVLVVSFLLLCGTGALARTRHASDSENVTLEHQQFLREYALGVRRLPMDGGKIYGWQLNDRVSFGRSKGENDEFGFSFEVSKRHRVEFTTDGLRWRRAIGGH